MWFLVDRQDHGRFFQRNEAGHVSEINGDIVDQLGLVVASMPLCQSLDMRGKSVFTKSIPKFSRAMSSF